MNRKKRVIDYKKSVTVKSLALLIGLSITILLLMELANFYYMGSYKRQAVKNYQSSLESYFGYWDNKLELINHSLLNLTNANGTDPAYWNICNSDDSLTFETGKTMLVAKMSEVAWNHDNSIMLFSYVPERKVFLKSTNHLLPVNKREVLSGDIRSYIDNSTAYNSVKWDYFQSDGNNYFINVYHVHSGYIGAIMKTDTILEGMAQENRVTSQVGLADDSGNSIFLFSEDKEEGGRQAEEFFIPMEHLPYQIKIRVLQKSLVGDESAMVSLSFITVLAGLLLLAWNIHFQKKFVLDPLNALKDAMESFSGGDLDIRLPDNNTSNEINTLYETFNMMAEQISHLKIAVYETQLEREKIGSNYMRLQIQPHFYTNILNLIYGLAQLQDYKTIQKLAITTGTYFRYLLGEKGTFVLLKEEIDCVINYIQIQQIRYGDCLHFEMQVDKKIENQLVLPMLLQTFTGNSIKHNITLVPMLHIRMEIWEEEKKLHIRISDNGKGFDKELLEKINSGENISKDGEHIGIMNVKERIRLFYGDTANVTITNLPVGARVDMVLPEIISEEENHEYTVG
ncbi:sensor histidine kinase [Hungatella hathewayi]